MGSREVLVVGGMGDISTTIARLIAQVNEDKPVIFVVNSKMAAIAASAGAIDNIHIVDELPRMPNLIKAIEEYQPEASKHSLERDYGWYHCFDKNNKKKRHKKL